MRPDIKTESRSNDSRHEPCALDGDNTWSCRADKQLQVIDILVKYH